MPKLRYKRVLLKLSGEALAGEQKFGINPATLDVVGKEIVEVHKLGLEMVSYNFV